MLDGAVVTFWTVDLEVRGSNPLQDRIWFESSAPPAPIVNSAMMNTLTSTVGGKMRQRGRGLATRSRNVKFKKMKSLTLRVYDCSTAFPHEESSDRFTILHTNSAMCNVM